MAKRRAPKVRKSRKTLLDLKPPKGMVYEAKVVQLYGEPVDAKLLRDIEAAGWRPVPQKRHPRTPLMWGGLRLMERSRKVHAAAVATGVSKAHFPLPESLPVCDGAAIMTDHGWLPMSAFREMQDNNDGHVDRRGYGGVPGLWEKSDAIASSGLAYAGGEPDGFSVPKVRHLTAVDIRRLRTKSKRLADKERARRLGLLE
jgi:hypothetical protein